MKKFKLTNKVPEDDPPEEGVEDDDTNPVGGTPKFK